MKPYWKYFLSGLLIFVVAGGFLFPYETYPELWNNYYFFKLIYFFWLFSIIASAFLMKGVFMKIITKNVKLDYSEVLSLSVFLGVSIIWLAYYTSNLTSYIVGALSFSFVLYLSILVLFYKRKTHLLNTEKKEKYAKNKIANADAKRLLNKIELLMKEQYLYRDSNLNLSKLAKKLNISSHLLSQFLNDNLNKSFSLFVNEYRINEAKRLLKTEHNLKTEVIAENCGFNSTSTFYAAFKKVTNTTPAKYLKIPDL